MADLLHPSAQGNPIFSLGGVGIREIKLLLELEGVRLALDERLALACALKDDFLDATAIPIGWRSPKPPCVGPG